ncbi:MAG: hypothetical protein QN198_10280 [Armatimonadota bacterium]|nr:hypothetical protein [Armatimonadota bacterium]MDR5703969.1 hypothetical protein [Armatimonadota bacterium]MDR7433839.1 hypothetical protein [Armatimonadota bacterium]
MDPNPFLWELITREKYKELLHIAEEKRRYPNRPLFTLVGKFMIQIGQHLVEVGEHLVGQRSDSVS